MKKFLPVFIRTIAAILFIWAISWLCDLATAGFRVYEILSVMPNQERWETAPLALKERDELLDQPFYFLGNGEQFYAFLGRDQKTVLKFFRHDHLSPRQLIRYLPLTQSIKTSLLSHKSRSDLSPLFDSTKLAYDNLREETAFIALHLNKTRACFKPVEIFDKLGIRHQIDLDATEFVLQRRAEPFCSAIDRNMQNNDIDAAKQQIHSLITVIKKQCQKGITNTDAAFKRNFGSLNGSAVVLDMGSFLKDERVKDPAGERAELERLTARLQRWLKKHHPELLEYFLIAKN